MASKFFLMYFLGFPYFLLFLILAYIYIFIERDFSGVYHFTIREWDFRFYTCSLCYLYLKTSTILWKKKKKEVGVNMTKHQSKSSNQLCQKVVSLVLIEYKFPCILKNWKLIYWVGINRLDLNSHDNHAILARTVHHIDYHTYNYKFLIQKRKSKWKSSKS